MIISFYQINRLFIDNSSYLGELIELRKDEINVNMSNISNIDLLLNEEYVEYNYIKVAITDTDYYYYYLTNMKYYNNQKTRYYFKLDALRTLKERDMLSHDINLTRYSALLDMTDSEKNYFWKNQDTKLSSNVIESYNEVGIRYNDDNPDSQKVWSNMRWLYVWLQPRELQNEGDKIFQYKFTKQIKENINTVDNESDLPLGIRIYKDYDNRYNNYMVGSAYRVYETGKYYRVKKDWDLAGPSDEYHSVKKFWYIEFTELKDFTYETSEYYLLNIPPVDVKNMANQLYCMVLPLDDVWVLRQYLENGISKSKAKLWSANQILPYLFDVESPNNWQEYIVDAKVSMLPPLEIVSDNYRFGRIGWSRNQQDIGKPALVIPSSVPYHGPDDMFSPLKTIQQEFLWYAAGELQESELFIPFMSTKVNSLFKLKSQWKFPEINKENIVQKKFYLSTTELRQELDIVKLKVDKATELYYYEDLFPGRTNVIYGFAPDGVDELTTIYYLMHSENSIFFDRDTSIPLFTSNYQSYIANNKNFVKQAQLQRYSDLAQNVIGSTSQAVGSTAVAKAVDNYSPYMAVASASGGIANALIQYGVQTKQFKWNIDNLKNAPGNYKASSATVSMMLSLGIFNLWVEVYNTNPYDKKVYDDLINDIGFEYFNFSYNLKQVIEHMFEGKDNKKFIRAILTGLSSGVNLHMPLLNILKTQLAEGLNVFINDAYGGLNDAIQDIPTLVYNKE